VTIGVLALQGDVREHLGALEAVGADTAVVRRPGDLSGLSGLVLPGGESTTLSMLLESSGMFDPLAELFRGGLPVFGTCAGLVLLSSKVLDGRADQRCFGVLDCTIRRNGFGRQIESFECVLEPDDPADATFGDLPAVFIRAPLVESVGPDVEVLLTVEHPSRHGPIPVMVRHGAVLATSFHPELTGDRRVHGFFRDMVEAARVPGRGERVVGPAPSGDGPTGTNGNGGVHAPGGLVRVPPTASTCGTTVP